MEDTPTPPAEKITALLNDAYINRVSNLKYSIKLAHEALILSRSCNHTALKGKSLNQLSLFYMIRGSYKRFCNPC